MLQWPITLTLLIAGWALVANGLERRRLTVPILFVLAGVLVGLSTKDALANALNTEVTQHAAELILAFLLFVDATEVRGGPFGDNPRAAFRILLIALPLGMAGAVVLGLWLLPGLHWSVLLLLACIVVPIDFAPAAAILRDTRIPERVRNLLNVEAGYNDGIIASVFVFALSVAMNPRGETPWDALSHAIPESLIAVAVGAVLGALIALLNNAAEERNLMTGRSQRMLMVVTPLLTFAVSTGLHGNGFVAAFVAGLTVHYLRRSDHLEPELELVEDLIFILTLGMWFTIGSAAVLAIADGVPWRTVVYCLLALTVLRMVPVVLALTGSRLDLRDRLMVGWLGPRGTPSIVFGLLAFNRLDAHTATPVLLTTVLVVLGSVVLHGVGYPAAVRAYYPEPRDSR